MWVSGTVYLFLTVTETIILWRRQHESDCDRSAQQVINTITPRSPPYLEKTDPKLLRNVLAIFRRNLSWARVDGAHSATYHGSARWDTHRVGPGGGDSVIGWSPHRYNKNRDFAARKESAPCPLPVLRVGEAQLLWSIALCTASMLCMVECARSDAELPCGRYGVVRVFLYPGICCSWCITVFSSRGAWSLCKVSGGSKMLLIRSMMAFATVSAVS